MLRIGTLFSGGLATPEQALKQMGKEHEIVFACEYDKFARQNYKANHPIEDEHFHIDINDMDGKQYKGKVDVIVGGSPCQDFSIAGLRAGIDGHRGQLIWQYYRIIMESQPEIFIYENVKGMVSDKGGKTLKDFLQVFRESGYHCHFSVLNTKDYGVPQNRERIYIIGFKNFELYHRFQFAPKIKLEKRLKDILESDVDEKYYLSDKMINYLSRKERAIKPYDGTQNHAPTLCAVYHKTPTDGFYIYQLPRGYNDGGIHEISPTISSNSWQENNFAITNKLRKLTPRECFRLQGCDDTFKIAVSNSQAYKIAGNAMSVNILEMVFNQIDKAKANEPTNTLIDFMY